MTNEYRLTLSTDSSNSMTPVGSIVSFSDDDLPLESDPGGYASSPKTGFG